MLHTIERHKGRVIESAIDPQTHWKPSGAPAATRDGFAIKRGCSGRPLD